MRIPRYAAVLFVPLLAVATAAATTGVAVPDVVVTGVGSLAEVTATSASNAWAVGGAAGDKTMIMRWNGTAWTQVPSPSPGPARSILTGVAATSASNAWAVGNTTNSKGTAKGLILHWNGGTWTQLPTPGGAIYLQSVAATSARNAWAVGTSTGGNGLILHWNGTSWKKVASPESTGFDGVAAISSSDAWAWGVGTSGSEIIRWNGTAWKVTPTPSTVLVNRVAANSAGNAWAVGYSTPATDIKTAILRWNGTAWKKVASPSPGSQPVLSGVAVTSASNAWAVGVSYKHVGGTLTSSNLIEHWNGSAWKQVSGPSLGTASSLLAVTATSAGSAWAIGNTEGSNDSTFAGQILRWNGSSWK